MTFEICTQCGGNHAPGPCPEAKRPRMIRWRPRPMAGVVSPMPVAWLAGSMVGEYEVTGLLGQGGMGVVYSGVHPLLGRKVAIKVLHRQAALVGEAAARFLQEARAASKLRHQNIVDVFAFGQMADGHYYQVMEFLEGESLRSVLHARGALTRAQARTVIVGVLSGLGAAHRRGIVHRDVKPDNIFLCAPIETLTASDVKVLDFGLAKNEFADESSIKTRTGMTLGTPAYMSPEQCRSVPGVDGRADLYAAGIVLYEMLVGQAPFQSESAFDLMTMQINLPAPRVSTVTGRAEPLDGVIAQALEKRPAARFDTAEDMLAAIDAALPARGSGGGGVDSAEREPVVVRSPSAIEVANRPTLVAESGGAQAAERGEHGDRAQHAVDRDETCVAPAARGARRDRAGCDRCGGCGVRGDCGIACAGARGGRAGGRAGGGARRRRSAAAGAGCAGCRCRRAHTEGRQLQDSADAKARIDACAPAPQDRAERSRHAAESL